MGDARARLRVFSRPFSGVGIVVVAHASLATAGGLESVTLQLTRCWRAQGNTVETLTYDDLPRWIPARLRRPAFPIWVTWWLIASRAAKRADLIDATTGDTWLLSVVMVRSRRTRIVVRSHGLELVGVRRERQHDASLGRRRHPVGRIYYRWLMLGEVRRSLRAADVVRVLSSEERAEVLRLGIEESRVSLATNGVPEHLLKGSLVPSGPPFGVVSITRWEPMKGSTDLARAMTEILRQDSTSHATVLGSGLPVEQVLQEFGAEVRTRVTVIPQYEVDQLPQVLDRHHVYLGCSYSEGMPLSWLEAMARRLVPVIRDVGAARDVITPDRGYVISSSGVGPFVQAVLDLFGDEQRRHRLAMAAGEFADQLAWPTVARRDLEQSLRTARACRRPAGRRAE